MPTNNKLRVKGAGNVVIISPFTSITLGSTFLSSTQKTQLYIRRVNITPDESIITTEPNLYWMVTNDSTFSNPYEYVINGVTWKLISQQQPSNQWINFVIGSTPTTDTTSQLLNFSGNEEIRFLALDDSFNVMGSISTQSFSWSSIM